MSGFLILPSRPSFVTILACAAVVSFIFCLHAAKAYPTIAPVKSGAQPILRPFKRYSLLSSEPGILSGSTSESQSWKDPERDATSVIFHQPSLLLRNGHLAYNPNTPDNRPHQEELSQVQRGQGLGGVKPASSIFTSLLDRQPSRVNHSPFVHSQNSELSGFVAPNNGNSQSGNHFSWHPSIIRKSSNIQQERPLPQSASQSHDQLPISGLTVSESRRELKTAWQSPISFRTSGYWRSHPDSKGHNSDNYNGFAGAGPRTIGSQSSTFGSSQNAPIVPSVSGGDLDTSVFKPHPSPEKLTSSITHVSQGMFPATSKNEKSNYMKVQSYLLWDSQTSDKPKGVNAAPSTYGFQDNVHRGHDFNRQTETNQARMRPDLFNTNYVANANGTNFNGGSVIKYQPASVIYRAPPRKDTPQKFEEASSANRNAKDAKSSQAHAAPRGPIQQIESSNPSKGHSHWSYLKKNSQQSIISNKEANSEARGYRFMRPSLLQKYSFGQRIASSTLSQDKRTDYSRDLLDATSPATPKSSSFQEVPLMVHSINATDRNLGSIYRTYKRPHGHEGYKSIPTSASNFNQEGNDNARSGGLSIVESPNGQNEQKIRSKPHVKSDMLKLVTLTGVKPTLLGINPEVWKMTTPQSKIGQHETTISPFNGEDAQGKDTPNVFGVLSSGQRNILIAKQPKFKAVTYHDILGSVSFSSVTPARTSTYRENLDNTTTTMMPNKLVSCENGTEINFVGKIDFRKAEEETQLSNMTVKETASEAKSVPHHGLSSEENLSENLSELDYLRTSTGNVSFQSLNLNL